MCRKETEGRKRIGGGENSWGNREDMETENS